MNNQMEKKIVIAIDGHSSSGKSTMAKDLAREIGYTYIDTGAMYRAVTLYALRHQLIHGDQIDEAALQAALPSIEINFRRNPETNRPDTYLNGENVEQAIRGMEVADKVSPVAALGFVRRALVAMQQAMGKEKGIVMDGRDIGTVVFLLRGGAGEREEARPDRFHPCRESASSGSRCVGARQLQHEHRRAEAMVDDTIQEGRRAGLKTDRYIYILW